MLLLLLTKIVMRKPAGRGVDVYMVEPQLRPLAVLSTGTGHREPEPRFPRKTKTTVGVVDMEFIVTSWPTCKSSP